jgi:hypothetical protein
MFTHFGAFVNGVNKKYRNLFYDSGLDAVVGECEPCLRRRRQSWICAGGLRGRIAVLEH